jgi:uncharacterized protein lin1253/lin1744
MIDFTKADNKHIKNALRPPKSFFTECFSKFPIYVWENKTDKIVSSERSQKNVKVIKKRLTKISRLDFWDTHEYFLWIGVSKTRIEFQMYRIQQYFENGQENFSVTLYNFEKFTEKEHIRLSVSFYGTTYKSGLLMLGNCKGAYSDYWLLQSLEDVFKRFKKNDALKYLDFAKMKETNSLSNLPMMFPHIFKYRGIIEYAQKINARGIQKDLIGEIIPSYYGLGSGRHCHVNMGKLTFKFLRTHKNVFKNSDEGFEDYKIRKELEKALGGKVLPEFNKYFRTAGDLQYIPKGIKPIRFQNWVIKNSVKAYEYRDYQNMLENLGIAFEGDFRILPKNFKQAHDDAVKAYNDMKDEQKRIEFANQLEKLLGLEQTIGNYTFVLPKKLQELKAEGKALSHCVGSYAGNVARGETVILFVRQKDKVDNPLYTLEIRKGRIIQLRGMKNKDADADAWEASKKLLSFAKKHKIAV